MLSEFEILLMILFGWKKMIVLLKECKNEEIIYLQTFILDWTFFYINTNFSKMMEYWSMKVYFLGKMIFNNLTVSNSWMQINSCRIIYLLKLFISKIFFCDLR